MFNHKGLRRVRIIIVTVSLLLLILLTGGCKKQLRSNTYSADSYDINATIAEDGSVRVEHQILYSFNGEIKSLDFIINNTRSVLLEDVEVAISENIASLSDSVYLADNENFKMQKLQQMEEGTNVSTQMTWEQKDLEDTVRLSLNALFENGSRRLVTIQYKLGKAVRKNDQTAYLKQKLNGLPDSCEIAQLSINYYFPYTVDDSDSHLFLLAKRQADFTELEEKRWSNYWQEIVGSETAEIVLLMPPDVFTELDFSSSLAPKEELIEIVSDSLTAMNEKNLRQESFRAFVYFMLIMSLVFLLVIYLVFDREGIASFKERYYLPDHLEIPPAVMGILMRKGKAANLIMSTLTDLVRREELRLEGLVFIWNNPSRNDYSGFKAYEIFLLQWLFDRVSPENNTISAVQLRDYARSKETSDEFKLYYDQFIKLLSEELLHYGLYDEAKSHYGRLIGQSLATVYFIMAIAVSIYLFSWLGLLLLVPSLFFFVYALLLRHLTSYGNEVYAQARAFYRYLGNFVELSETNKKIPLPDCQQVIELLPYAVALDKTKLYMRQLIASFKVQDECNEELLAVYQRQHQPGKTKHKKAKTGDEIAAMKAASLEQLRLLGRDLISMESILTSGFYLSSGFYLFDDH